MANLQVKMSLDAAGYTSGIKQANEATKEFTNQITQSTKSLPNAKKQMMQVKREAQNLAVAIGMMSDAERSSAEGQAMIRHLNELRAKGAVLIDTIGDINQEMRVMASDTSGLDAAGQAVGIFGNTLSSVAGIIGLVTGEEDKMKQAVVAFTTVQSVLNTITQISNALNKSSILVLKTKAMQQKLATVATKLETAAQGQNIIVTKAATIATKAFNAVVKANPIGLLITALTTVIGLFAMFSSNSDEATESMKNQKTEAERLAEAQRHAQETIANKVADSTSKFVQLAIEWKNLKTEAEQLAWIDNNKNAFHSLGLNIKTVTDANEVFIKQMPKILEVLRIQAEAAANLDLYIEQYKKRQERLNNPTLEGGGQRFAPEVTWSKLVQGVATDADGNRYTREQSDKQLRQMAERYKLTANEDYYVQQGSGVGEDYFDRILYLTEKGKKKVIEAETKAAHEIASRRQSEEDRLMNSYLNNYEAKQEEARTKIAQIPQMYDPSTSANPYNTSSSRQPRQQRTRVTRDQKDTIKKEADKTTKEVKVGLDALEAQAKDLEDKRNKLIDATGNVMSGKEAEFNRLGKDLDEVNEKIKNANKLLHPEKNEDEILSYTEQLSKDIDDRKKEYELLMSKGKGAILDEDKARANEIQDIIKEKTKQLEQANKILDDLGTEAILPEDQTIEEKIKEYQDIIDKNKLEIRINPNLSTVDKAILKNQIDDAQDELDKWQSAKEQRAAGAQYVIPEVTIGSKGKIDKNLEDYRKQVEAKWNDIQPNLSKRLKPVKLDDLLFTSEKNLIESQKYIREWAETGINEVKELFDKKLLPANRAKDLINQFNAELKKNHLDPIKVDIETNAEKFTKQMVENTFDAVSNVNSLVSAWTSLEDTIDSNASSWEKFMAVMQLVQTTYNSVMETMTILQSVMEALNLVKQQDIETTEANIAAKSAETGVQIADTTAKAADIVATETQIIAGEQASQTNLKQATTASAAAIAEGTKSGAKLPFPANIAAIAAIIAVIVGALAMATKFKFADGGVVGGHSYYGDKILARVNSQEMIATTQQQKKIWEQMNQRQTIYAPLNPELHGNVTITGDQLNIALTNRQRKISKRR